MTKPKQLVFIDDSGDPGFQLAGGSSRYFVIALLIFDDELEAEVTAIKIKMLRRDLGWRSDHEFKFNKCSSEIKTRLLSAVKTCKFRVYACLVDKTMVKAEQRETNFYNFIILETLKKSATSLRDASIRLDGQSDKLHKKVAASYFRKQIGSAIRDFKYADSKTDNLIQLADMIAGAIYRSKQTDKSDHAKYLPLIRKQIEEIWEYSEP